MQAGQTNRFAAAWGGCCLLLLAATGCQVDVNGQTLPSPYYLQDDVQYFPAGPEFKLSREAAALAGARTTAVDPAGVVPAPLGPGAMPLGPAPGPAMPAGEPIPAAPDAAGGNPFGN